MIDQFVFDDLAKSDRLFMGTLSWHEHLSGSGALISDFLTGTSILSNPGPLIYRSFSGHGPEALWFSLI